MITGRQIIPDTAWCWWTQPRATRIGQTIFVGGITSRGGVFAAAHDLVDSTTRRHLLATIEPDDHNNPAIVAEPGKPLLAFYCGHDADDMVRWRVSVRAEDVTAWETERSLCFGAVTTYAQAHAVADEIHLFTRTGDTAWAYAMSPDWAESWSQPVQFIALDTDQETYMPTALLDDGQTLRVAIAGHPKNRERRPWHRIAAAVVDLRTGSVSLPNDDRELANLRTGAGLPLTGDQLEHVCDAGPGRTLNLFDVSSGGVFEVAFASKAEGDDVTEDARYHVAALRSSTWEVDEVVPAGDIFGYIHAGFYVGGIAFPHFESGVCYVSRERDGTWHLERWRRQPDGSWSARPIFEPSPVRIVRPWPVRNPSPDVGVVALRLERYDDDYMETLSHLIGGA